MTKNSDYLADSFEADSTGGLLSRLLAEEETIDRRSLWRLGSWGVGAVAAVIVAIVTNQSVVGWRRDQVAAADLARQSQQIQLVARESQNETRRLASAIDTLGGDRDRLYTRVTVLEQGLDSVTGAIARQNSPAASSPAVPSPSPATEVAPAVAPVATAQPAMSAPEKPAPAGPEKAPGTIVAMAKPASPASAVPATSLMSSKSIMAPLDAAAGKLIEPAGPTSAVNASEMPGVVAAAHSANATADDEAAPKAAIQRTQFGVDLGSANSVDGLRALWRGLLKSQSNAELALLRPIIVVKEATNGLGLQLRLVAGPLNDARAAAGICAALVENQHKCEPAVFDGQRLAMKVDEQSPATPNARKHTAFKRAAVEQPARPPEASKLSTLFGKKNSQ